MFRDDAESVRETDHRELVFGVLDLGGRQVDQGALYRVFFVSEDEYVRTANGLTKKQNFISCDIHSLAVIHNIAKISFYVLS